MGTVHNTVPDEPLLRCRSFNRYSETDPILFLTTKD